MPLQKIIKIENVGRFTKLNAQGDVHFRQITLIYGSNAHGKTTIANILRSLHTNDPAYIRERATLGSSEQPFVELLLTSGNVQFKNGQWTGLCHEFEIFDTTFVADNVYTGEHVDPQHRKNMYDVLVGSSAVTLAKDIDSIDSQGRACAREISLLEDKLREEIQAPFTIAEFLQLSPEVNVEEKIQEYTTKLNAVRKSKQVLQRPALEKFDVPLVPRFILETLNKTLPDISKSARDRVREHIQNYLDQRGEQWLRQGLDYIDRDFHCPFCAQDVSEVDLVTLYRQYFSNEYTEYLVSIERAINAMNQALGERTLHDLQKRALENEARIQGWVDLANLAYASASTKQLESAWEHLRELLDRALKRKLENPGESFSVDPVMEASLRDFQDLAGQVDTINSQIVRANEEISELKRQAVATDQEELEKELRRLRNIQIKAKSEVMKLCSDLLEQQELKRNLEENKKQKRQELEVQAEAVLSRYEESINILLRNFGSNFWITGTKPSFSGGKASSTYQISINDIALDLGDSKTPRGTPCFRTALSAGDKSTLALGFFLSRLGHEQNLGNKVVVLDDPLSSLDGFRIACTVEEICNLASRASQAIVLSHDPYFLKRIYDIYHDKSKIKTLIIARDAHGYALKEWDIYRYCLPEAHQDYFNLRSFLEQGLQDGMDIRSVARAIRPYIEGNLRYQFPNELLPHEWLGEFIDKIRSSSEHSALSGLKSQIEELEALNNYSKQFHHSAQNPNPPIPDETELKTFVERAIRFVQRG